jgi:hypothetical protein
MNALLDFFGGRKCGLVLFGMVAAVVVGLALKLDGTQILDAIKWLVGIGAGSIAVEDGLKGIGGTKGTTPTAPTT